MYSQVLKVSVWNGPPLSLVSGQPLTHDKLSALKILDSDNESESDIEVAGVNFEDATISAPLENSSCIGPDTVTDMNCNKDRIFSQRPTTDDMEQTSDGRVSATSIMIPSGPYISLSINASSSVFHAMEVVLDTQLADPLFETCTSGADDAGRTNWLDTSESDDQTKTCIRTLDDPMFVTLDQPICPLFHSLKDPMFAVAVDVNWERLLPLHDTSDLLPPNPGAIVSYGIVLVVVRT
jgi:hypothetical protein